LKLNKKNKKREYLFHWDISNDNIEIVKLINYAIQHQIIFELNEKNDFGE